MVNEKLFQVNMQFLIRVLGFGLEQKLPETELGASAAPSG